MKFSPKSQTNLIYNNTFPVKLFHNVWILAIGNTGPIISHQALEYLRNAQVKDKSTDIIIVLPKRDIEEYARKMIGEKWATFDQKW